MSIKKKFLIIAVAVLLIVLLFLFIWFLTKQKISAPTTVVNEKKVEKVIGLRDSNEADKSINQIETKDVDASLQSLAITFTERYGSYSSESDFANLYDVMDLMTASFRAQTEKYLASVKSSGEFYGVTTKVLTTTITVNDELNSIVEVSIQREESAGSPQNSEIKYQKLILSCLKENDVWKVDGAVWQ